MTTLTTTVLDQVSLVDGDTMDLQEALDLGAYRTLGFVLTVHEAGVGDGATLVVEHAIDNVSTGYVSLEPAVEVSLDAARTVAFQVPAFLRWVRWTVSGRLTTGATVSLSVIARD